MTLGSTTVQGWDLCIKLFYLKKIQCQERRPFVTLPWNTHNTLTTMQKSLELANCCQATEYLFTFRRGSKQFCMTYSLFTSMLRYVLGRLNMSTSDYSGHSFRRGSCWGSKSAKGLEILSLLGLCRANTQHWMRYFHYEMYRQWHFTPQCVWGMFGTLYKHSVFYCVMCMYKIVNARLINGLLDCA